MKTSKKIRILASATQQEDARLASISAPIEMQLANARQFSADYKNECDRQVEINTRRKFRQKIRHAMRRPEQKGAATAKRKTRALGVRQYREAEMLLEASSDSGFPSGKANLLYAPGTPAE